MSAAKSQQTSDAAAFQAAWTVRFWSSISQSRVGECVVGNSFRIPLSRSIRPKWRNIRRRRYIGPIATQCSSIKLYRGTATRCWEISTASASSLCWQTKTNASKGMVRACERIIFEMGVSGVITSVSSTPQLGRLVSIPAIWSKVGLYLAGSRS